MWNATYGTCVSYFLWESRFPYFFGTYFLSYRKCYPKILINQTWKIGTQKMFSSIPTHPNTLDIIFLYGITGELEFMMPASKKRKGPDICTSLLKMMNLTCFIS